MSANNLSILLSAFICSSGGYDGRHSVPAAATDGLSDSPRSVGAALAAAGRRLRLFGFKVDKGAHTIQPDLLRWPDDLEHAAVTALPASM